MLPCSTLPNSRSFSVVLGTQNCSAARLTPICPHMTASMAFIIDSLLHCLSFFSRRLSGGEAFSFPCLHFFQPSQALLDDRNRFPRLGIAVSYSCTHCWLQNNFCLAGITRREFGGIPYTTSFPCTFAVTSGRQLVKVSGRQ